MPLETSSLHEDAVLWPFAAYGIDGENTVSSPVAIRVRAEKYIASQASLGNDPTSKTFDVWVDREVAIHSVVWFGHIDDLPGTVTGVFRVSEYEEIPDIKGRNVERVIKLLRQMEALPPVV